jgi:hypothetical protein
VVMSALYRKRRHVVQVNVVFGAASSLFGCSLHRKILADTVELEIDRLTRVPRFFEYFLQIFL